MPGSYLFFGFMLYAFIVLTMIFVVRPALGRRVLGLWCAERGLGLHEARRRYLHSTDFQWSPFDTRVLFGIRITDAAGNVRTGVALAGYRWFYCLSPRVDVIWDPPERPATG
jgi:hypothetical protein